MSEKREKRAEELKKAQYYDPDTCAYQGEDGCRYPDCDNCEVPIDEDDEEY